MAANWLSRHGMSAHWMSAPWNRLGDSRLSESRLGGMTPYYPLVGSGSFAFEVSLRKSVRISLIAVSGSVHKDRLKQCLVRRPLLV